MRFEGRVKSWNADRGFGFIEPTLGRQEVFLHISACLLRSVHQRLVRPSHSKSSSIATGRSEPPTSAFRVHCVPRSKGGAVSPQA